MGLLKYAAGSAAIVALACCHSAARAQSNSDQLPPVVVNPNAPPKPARQIRRDRDRRRPGPVRPAANTPASTPAQPAGGGGDCRQGARAHQPHRQLDQRGQRRDAGDQQSRLAGRRVANRSRPRYLRERRTGFDHEHPAARRQYRPDPGDDRRHPDQRSDRRKRRFRFRDVCAERHRADRGAERPAKRALWFGRDGRRRQHHHQEGLRARRNSTSVPKAEATAPRSPTDR